MSIILNHDTYLPSRPHGLPTFCNPLDSAFIQALTLSFDSPSVDRLSSRAAPRPAKASGTEVNPIGPVAPGDCSTSGTVARKATEAHLLRTRQSVSAKVSAGLENEEWVDDTATTLGRWWCEERRVQVRDCTRSFSRPADLDDSEAWGDFEGLSPLSRYFIRVEHEKGPSISSLLVF